MKLKRMVYRVSGAGQFPIDMLRYDACFPASERDSALIQQHDEFRQVHVARYWAKGMAEMTDARWRSFGWQIEENTTVTPITL